MIPTFLTTLAVGTITNMVATIMALTAWIAGSQIIQGNIFFDTTNNPNPAIYLNAKQQMTITGAGLNFSTTGTQSGVSLLDNNVKALVSKTFDCTATGGNVKVNNGAAYDTCFVPPQLTTTGALTRVTLMTAANPTGASFDCSFIKGRKNGTGSVPFTAMGNWAAITGSIISFGSGNVIRWNGADSIKCGTLTSIPTTASFSAKLKVDYFDDTSE